MNILELIKRYDNCPCGQEHVCDIKDVQIGSGLVHEVGKILKNNNFPTRLLLVADKTTLAASDGIIQALSDFDLSFLVFDTLRVATMEHVRVVENLLDTGIQAVIAVGTGSVHDPCRLACAHKNKPLCLFATAPSMDGFASYSAPIVNNNFKATYPAKCPDVIIGDTKILAAAPAELKSAGFGDMVAKYIALVDWQVSHIVSGEICCEAVRDLTRFAVDNVMKMADRVTRNDEESAKSLFEGLLLTGVAMSFTKTSRPGSGSEHVMAHYVECKELLEHKIPNFHGEDVGVMTLIMLKFYKELVKRDSVAAHRENLDWEDVYQTYGPLADDVKKLNLPVPVTENVDPEVIEQNWHKIQEIVDAIPSYEEVLSAMKRAGCKTTIEEIDKSPQLIAEAFKYHQYMRRRLSLLRLLNMID